MDPEEKGSEQGIVLLMSILMASGLMRLVASGSGLMGHKNQENIRVTNPQKQTRESNCTVVSRETNEGASCLMASGLMGLMGPGLMGHKNQNHKYATKKREAKQISSVKS